VLRPIAFVDIDRTNYQGISLIELMKYQGRELIEDGPRIAIGEVMDMAGSHVVPYEPAIQFVLETYADALRRKEYATILESAERFYAGTEGWHSFARRLRSA
jgi:hypothetical protein